MEPLELATRYFDAWNRRDPEAIAAAFAPDGTYSDPNVPEGLGPEATARVRPGACSPASRPRLRDRVGGGVRAGTVAAQWVMTGTNDGPFQGLPPSGRAVQAARSGLHRDRGRPRAIGRRLLRHGGRPAAARACR